MADGYGLHYKGNDAPTSIAVHMRDVLAGVARQMRERVHADDSFVVDRIEEMADTLDTLGANLMALNEREKEFDTKAAALADYYERRHAS
jgi:hypothetical protein